MGGGLTKGDREGLAKLARGRAKMAKTDVDHRARVMMLGIDHKTAGKYRPQQEITSGEIPSGNGEVPSSNGEVPSLESAGNP